MAIIPTIINIDKSECIGNSLVSIKANYDNIKNSLTDVNTNITSFNSILNNLTTIVNTISSTPQRAAAWVNFSGRRDLASGLTRLENTERFLFSSYNITSVTREDTGIYRGSISTPLTQGFSIIGTASPLPPGTAGTDAGVVNIHQGGQGFQAISPISEFRILTRTLQGQQFDPPQISLVLYTV